MEFEADVCIGGVAEEVNKQDEALNDTLWSNKKRSNEKLNIELIKR